MKFCQTLAARPLFLVLFVLAKLVLAIGMANAAPVASGLSEAEKATYMLPDGTLPVFCLTIGDESDSKSHFMCDGCSCSGDTFFRPLSALLDVDYLAKPAPRLNEQVLSLHDDLVFQARAPPVA